MIQILIGDCLVRMKELADNSIDSVVCDPPYLLEFMGKAFDRQHRGMAGANAGQQMQAWHYRWAKEAFRVMKPGAYIAAFGGDRTYHRLYSALEDAGLEPRHTCMWLFGQGFPKSKNVTRELEQMDWCSCED